MKKSKRCLSKMSVDELKQLIKKNSEEIAELESSGIPRETFMATLYLTSQIYFKNEEIKRIREELSKR